MAKKNAKKSAKPKVKEEMCADCGNATNACACAGTDGACCSGGSTCACLCHRSLAFLVLAFGATFLFQALGWLSPAVVKFMWPSFVILAGLVKLGEGKCTCCRM